MESKFKLRISRIFHNSCKSCDDVATRRDVVEKSPFLSRSQSVPTAVPQPKPLPRPSICKPRTPPSLHVNNACISSSKEVHGFVPLTHKNRASPRKSKSKPKSKSPVSPVERYSSFYDCSGTRYYAVEDDRRKKKKKNKVKASQSLDDHDFFCGDDEREEEGDERTTDTLFSSRSLSSSELSENRRRTTRRRNRTRMTRLRTELGQCVGVRGSFAVVKKSRDPYGDFRKSMVEMITEREIFGEEELEKLLLCFLSLNSSHHHKIIVRAFNEIWDALH